MHRIARLSVVFASGALLSGVLGGCARHYVVPGRAANMGVFGDPPANIDAARDAHADPSIQSAMDRRPLASFPAAIAIVQVQDAGYRRWNQSSYGHGRYSVVVQREAGQEKDLERIVKLPQVRAVTPLSRLLLSNELKSDMELRQAAASLHADMLVIYTFDTTFSKDDFASPLTLVTLGLFPSKSVKVRTTASGLLMDTRSGYIYGTLEATSKPESQLANAWTSESAADDARRRAEAEALTGLVSEMEKLWPGVVAAYATPMGSPTAGNEAGAK